jgi:lactoylglutathione lyase
MIAVSRAANRSRSGIAIDGLFEAHLTVTDLNRAVRFYGDSLGFSLALEAASRQAAFFWIGEAGTSMLGLWAAGSGPQRMSLHVAFRAPVSDVVAAPRALKAAGIVPLDFDGAPADEPVVIAWMPAVATYFHDPDGNLLEYIAMLPQEPRPEMGVLPWHLWESAT